MSNRRSLYLYRGVISFIKIRLCINYLPANKLPEISNDEVEIENDDDAYVPVKIPLNSCYKILIWWSIVAHACHPSTVDAMARESL